MRNLTTIISIICLFVIAIAITNFSFSSDHNSIATSGTPRNLALGRVLYVNNCASCHGTNLEGEPNWQSLKEDGAMPAPPHDESGHTWHHDDQLLFDYTKKGGQYVIGGDFKSDMPGFGELLSDEEIWAVLSFIKNSWSEKIRKRQNQISTSKKGNRG